MVNFDQSNLGIYLLMLPQWNINQPPLGIAYLTSFLRTNGFSVVQRDLSIELFHRLPEEKRYIMESAHHLDWIHNFFELIYPQIKDVIDEWINEIVSHNFGIIGFSIFTVNKALVLFMIKEIKQRSPDKIVIAGGPQVTRYEEDMDIINNEFIDFIVTDEGEQTLHDLLSILKNRGDIRRVKGIMFREGNKRIDTGERPLMASLDSLPFPTISDFPLEYYKDLSIPILSSRGCFYRCSFCSERAFWKSFRYRSGNNVYNEFKQQSGQLGKDSFYIVDSLINGNIKELEALCDLIIQDKKLKIFWGGKAAIRPEMTKALLRKMYDAGNRSIAYGLESGSEKVLKDMRKSFTVDLAKRVIKETKEAGIAVGIFWIVGFPTEDETDFQKSIDFLREVKDYVATVTPGYGCGILRGSELFSDYKRFGITHKEDGWYSLTTTPSIREERLKRFKEECVSLGITMD